MQLTNHFVAKIQQQQQIRAYQAFLSVVDENQETHLLPSKLSQQEFELILQVVIAL